MIQEVEELGAELNVECWLEIARMRVFLKIEKSTVVRLWSAETVAAAVSQHCWSRNCMPLGGG